MDKEKSRLVLGDDEIFNTESQIANLESQVFSWNRNAGDLCSVFFDFLSELTISFNRNLIYEISIYSLFLIIKILHCFRQD